MCGVLHVSDLERGKFRVREAILFSNVIVCALRLDLMGVVCLWAPPPIGIEGGELNLPLFSKKIP